MVQYISALSYCVHVRTVLIVFLFIARAFISGGFQAAYVYTPEVWLLFDSYILTDVIYNIYNFLYNYWKKSRQRALFCYVCWKVYESMGYTFLSNADLKLYSQSINNHLFIIRHGTWHLYKVLHWHELPG